MSVLVTQFEGLDRSTLVLAGGPVRPTTHLLLAELLLLMRP